VLVNSDFGTLVRLGAAGPVLTINSTRLNDLHAGQFDIKQTIVIENSGLSPASSLVKVIVAEENQYSVLIQRKISGSGWACVENTCTRNDTLAAGASYPPIEILWDIRSFFVNSQSIVKVFLQGGGAATTA